MSDDAPPLTDEQLAYDLREKQRVINREALRDILSQTTLTHDQGRAVLEAIISGRVRHVRVTY